MILHFMMAPRGGTADAEIKGGGHGGSPGLSKVPFSKPLVGPNIALHAVPAYRASTFSISAFPASSISVIVW